MIRYSANAVVAAVKSLAFAAYPGPIVGACAEALEPELGQIFTGITLQHPFGQSVSDRCRAGDAQRRAAGGQKESGNARYGAE